MATPIIPVVRQAGWMVILTAAVWFAASRPALAQMSLDVVNVDGTGLRRLAQIPQYQWTSFPNWSPDGKLIVFDAFWNVSSGQFDPHLFIVPAEGGEPKDIGSGRRACFTADGKQVLFEISQGLSDTGELWISNIDGTGREMLFAGRLPRCSPDGSKFLYTSEDDGPLSLYVYDMVEGTKTKLVSGTGDAGAWSPDGAKICFTRRVGGRRQVVVADADANPKSFKVVFDKNLTNSYLNWNPGEKILVTAKAEGLNKMVLQIDPEGAEKPVPLVTREASHYDDAAWSPGSKMIGFVTNRRKADN